MRRAMASVAGPQLFIPCTSYSGERKETCAGSGSGVGAAVAEALGVGVGGRGVNEADGVTGKAVGISPTGLITFCAYVRQTSNRHASRELTAGICKIKNASRINPASAIRIIRRRWDMRESLPYPYKN